MPKNRVPILVKHCAVAIFKEGKGIKGSTKEERFKSSLEVARHRLVEYGFLMRGSEEGDPNDIKLTSKGRVREAYHARERGGRRKNTLFDKMYKWIENEILENLKSGRDAGKDQDTK
jgi:hypothetical protein